MNHENVCTHITSDGVDKSLFYFSIFLLNINKQVSELNVDFYCIDCSYNITQYKYYIFFVLLLLDKYILYNNIKLFQFHTCIYNVS